MPSLVCTVDALSELVTGVTAYLADPNRAIIATVLQGSWSKWRRDLYQPPAIIFGHGAGFEYAGAAAKPTTRTPGYVIGAGTTYAPPGVPIVAGVPMNHAADIVGQRRQTFDVWVWAVAPGTYEDLDPATIAKQSDIALFALADVTMTALRAIHGADLECLPGKPLGQVEGGEGVYGAACTWSFIAPIPVLGDAYPFEQVQAFGIDVSMSSVHETAGGT